MSMINLPNFNFVLMIAILITFVNLIDTMTVLVTKSEKSLADRFACKEVYNKLCVQQVVVMSATHLTPTLWAHLDKHVPVQFSQTTDREA